jgi:hypothetical protein
MGIKVKKKEVIQAVLENPEPACMRGILTCNGGFNAGQGRISFQGEWIFFPFSATHRPFFPTDEFVETVIGSHWRELRPLYEKGS